MLLPPFHQQDLVVVFERILYCFLELFRMNLSGEVDWAFAMNRIPTGRIGKAEELCFQTNFS
jgi:hypothetical protein